jgi:hypothetical protein
MPIEVAALATTLVSSFLLPYVKEGVKQIAEAVSEKVSGAAANHVTGVAQKVWDKVRSVFTSEEEKGALTQFEKRPDATKSLVEELLKERLEKDSALAKHFDELVNSPGPDGVSTGAQIMHASGIVGILDARGQHISNVHSVRQGGVVIGREEPGDEPDKPRLTSPRDKE